MKRDRLVLAFSIFFVLLGLSRDARGQSIIAHGAARDVQAGTAIEGVRGVPRQNARLQADDRAELANSKPTIDLEIYFDANSAVLPARSVPAVNALGKALSDPGLKGSTFVIAGYTDSLEDEAYSQRLAQRRANAVKRYLVQKFDIPPDDLVTVGYGSAKLKDSMNPFSLVNNRVQVINMEVKR